MGEIRTNRRAVIALIFIVCTVTALDQATKWWIVQTLYLGERVSVIPGIFDLTLTYNRGAAFGMFSSIENSFVRHSLLGILSALALIAVLYVILREARGRIVPQFGLALILGGALGNVLDRIRVGAVVDFLDFYIGDLHWPAFNVADSAICVGVGILLLWRAPVVSPNAGPVNELKESV